MSEKMKLYIGSQVLQAEPMTREEYCESRGWTVTADENPDDAGYSVNYGGGYRSWLAKNVFEDTYAPFDGMNFGLAIAALKLGMKVARAGWNGKGMWLALGEGRRVYPDQLWNKHTSQFAHDKASQTPAGGDVTTQVLPYIIMKTATGEILMGWLASQTDMLAEDWCIVD